MNFDGQVSYDGTEEPSDAVMAQALQCAEQVGVMKKHARLPQLTKSFDLPDGTQVYVADLQHVKKLHIVPPEPYESTPPPLPGLEFPEMTSPVTIAGVLSGGAYTGTGEYKPVEWLYRPDSGAVDGQPPEGEDQLTIINDRVTLSRTGTPSPIDLFTIPEASYKLGVPPGDIFEQDPLKVETQLSKVEPGLYTGAMASIVQLMLGVGRIVQPDYEERWQAWRDRRGMPTKSLEGDVTRRRNGDVTYSTNIYDLPSTYRARGEEVQIEYDYRFNRTHGIMWGQRTTRPDDFQPAFPFDVVDDRKDEPFLVELGQRGIYAMPFPRDLPSRFHEVQEHYKAVYPGLDKFKPFRDNESLFEAFGGFPTGESIPKRTDEKQKWVSAGLLIEADEDLSKFYEGSALCSAHGWSFHPSAPRAINVCYKIEQLRKIGYCYEVKLEIEEKSLGEQVRNPRYDELVAALGLSDPVDRYKALRLTEEDTRTVLNGGDFDSVDAVPDWTIKAELAEVRKGIIDYPGLQCPRGDKACLPSGSPKFKFYEPLIGSVIHFTFENDEVDAARADGPIFATYADGAAEILNFAYHPGGENVEEEEINTRQQCQYTGTWKEGWRRRTSNVVGHFYSSSFDPRERIDQEGYDIRTVTGKKIGWADRMDSCHPFGSDFTVSRVYYGTESWEGERSGGRGLKVAAVCSSNNRSVFFMCVEKNSSSKQEYRGFSGRKGIGSSGTVHYGTLYNFIFHWFGCGYPLGKSCPGDPFCRFRICNTVTVNPEACMGTDEPGKDIDYMVCCVNNGEVGGCYAGSDLVIVSPAGENTVIISALVTTAPQAPPAWSETDGKKWEYEYEVRGFGHPLMHNRVIHEDKETFTDSSQLPLYGLSWMEWWNCSIPGMCPSYPWPARTNHYGPEYIETSKEFGMVGTVTYGKEPSVDGRILFGVVD